MVQALLGDESVGQAGTAAACQQPRSQQAGPVPVAVGDLENRQLQEQVFPGHRHLRIAQQLGQDDGRKSGLGMLERDRDRLDIGARGTRQVGDERAGVDRDQERSSRSARTSTENLTRPRSARSFS